MGRKPLPNKQRRDKQVRVRVTQAELDALNAWAADNDVDLGTWIRDLVFTKTGVAPYAEAK